MRLPYSSIRRMMRQNTSMKVSKEAVELMLELVEGYVKLKTLKAEKIAERAGKRTIMHRDLELTI